MPYRTQRTRTSKPGIPQGSVYIGRPSQWGNPAIVGRFFEGTQVNNRYLAVSLFYDHCKRFARTDPEGFSKWVLPLIDRDVCCWCPIGEPCHGDILLYLARRIKPILEKSQFRTLISADVEDWPDLSGVILL